MSTNLKNISEIEEMERNKDIPDEEWVTVKPSNVDGNVKKIKCDFLFLLSFVYSRLY